jgi:hypothetical protein
MRRCSRARGAFRRRRPRERSCESPAWSAARVGRRGQPPHVFIGCTKTSTRPLVHPLSRGTSRPRALLRLLQDQCFHEHDCGPLEHPGHRICGRGDCPLLDRVSPIEGNHRMGSRSGVEEQPILDAPRGDCSPRGLCPNPDRFGRLLSRPSLFHPVRSDAGRERDRHRARACKATRATGPCDAGLPRRSPTFTSPRHLPSRGRSRANEGSCRPDELKRQYAGAFFTAQVCARGTPARARQLGQSVAEASEPASRRSTAAPLETSAFE